MNEYSLGELVAVESQFYDEETGAVVAPTVTAQVKDPNDGVTTPSVSKVTSSGEGFAQGVMYKFTIDAEIVGKWYYRLVSAFPHQGAIEGSFTVKASAFS